MESFVHSDDHGAIEALIHRQFASLSWAPGNLADWEGFAADFFPQASLYPSARPACAWLRVRPSAGRLTAVRVSSRARGWVESASRPVTVPAVVLVRSGGGC